MSLKFKTREQWLAACAKRLEIHFRKNGVTLDSEYRVSCGFPKSSGMGYSAIGQCWSKTVSTGKVSEMFISPILEDASRVADVLAHELVHHAVGIKEGHNKVFAEACKAIGLKGPWTATTADEKFTAWWDKNKGWLGDYPHHAMAPWRFGEVPKLPPGVPVPTPEGGGWETTPRRKSGRVIKFSCKCGMKFATSVTQAADVTVCPACKSDISQ